MGKIPLTGTIEGAYGFTFRNFLSLLGIGWLPMLIMGIGFYVGLRPYFSAFQTVVVSDDPGVLLTALPMLFLGTSIAFIAMTIMFVGMTSLALGKLQAPVFVYFSLRYPVWRLLGALICVYLLLILGGVVVGIVAGVIGSLAAAGGEGVAALVGFVGVIVLIWFVVYATLRLIFFIAPVTVEEGRKVIRRSWSLARGNVWRIFVLLLAAALPVAIVQMIAQSAVLGQAMLGTPLPAEDLAPEEALALVTEMLAQMWAILPILIPLWIVLTVFAYGILSATSAFAYRSLVSASGGELASAVAQ